MSVWRLLRDCLLDLFFPPNCAHCHRLGSYLCHTCFTQIAFFSLPLKIKLEPLYLDELIVVGKYEGVLKSLITTLKYQGVKPVAVTLARLTYYTVSLLEVEAVTAVPIHRRRQQERGFNQSAEVAQELARLLQKPYLSLLHKAKHTTRQALITDRQQRLTHVQNSFSFLPPANTLPNGVLLVDDVTTTGTTLNECAKILKENGVHKVVGLCLAHGN